MFFARRPQKVKGFYAFELLLTLLVFGFLAGFAIQRGRRTREAAEIQVAVQDIIALEQDLSTAEEFLTSNGEEEPVSKKGPMILGVQCEITVTAEKFTLTIPKKTTDLCKNLRKSNSHMECKEENDKTTIVIQR